MSTICSEWLVCDKYERDRYINMRMHQTGSAHPGTRWVWHPVSGDVERAVRGRRERDPRSEDIAQRLGRRKRNPLSEEIAQRRGEPRYVPDEEVVREGEGIHVLGHDGLPRLVERDALEIEQTLSRDERVERDECEHRPATLARLADHATQRLQPRGQLGDQGTGWGWVETGWVARRLTPR